VFRRYARRRRTRPTELPPPTVRRHGKPEALLERDRTRQGRSFRGSASVKRPRTRKRRSCCRQCETRWRRGAKSSTVEIPAETKPGRTAKPSKTEAKTDTQTKQTRDPRKNARRSPDKSVDEKGASFRMNRSRPPQGRIRPGLRAPVRRRKISAPVHEMRPNQVGPSAHARRGARTRGQPLEMGGPNFHIK